MLTPTQRHKSSFTVDERRSVGGAIPTAFGVAGAPRHDSSLVALFNRISLAGPIGAKIVGQIEGLHIGKTHVA